MAKLNELIEKLNTIRASLPKDFNPDIEVWRETWYNVGDTYRIKSGSNLVKSWGAYEVTLKLELH